MIPVLTDCSAYCLSSQKSRSRVRRTLPLLWAKLSTAGSDWWRTARSMTSIEIPAPAISATTPFGTIASATILIFLPLKPGPSQSRSETSNHSDSGAAWLPLVFEVMSSCVVAYPMSIYAVLQRVPSALRSSPLRYPDHLDPDELRLEHRFALLEKHLDDVAQVALQLVETRAQAVG